MAGTFQYGAFVLTRTGATNGRREKERARKRAGMEDLRFHDLRHEGTSRLFEAGFGLVEVAAFTGHRDMRMLKRYTHMESRRLAEKLREDARREE